MDLFKCHVKELIVFYLRHYGKTFKILPFIDIFLVGMCITFPKAPFFFMFLLLHITWTLLLYIY